MDFLEGRGTSKLDFGDLDMRYFLKLRSHINLCMPHVFRHLAKRFDMLRLGGEGVVPLMFYVDLEVSPVALAFGREVTSSHRIGIHRHREQRPGGVTERLLLDSRAVFTAPAGSGNRGSFGWEANKGDAVEAGRAEVLQVFTRPMAPPGGRGVAEMPETFRELRIQPWRDPYPTLESFQAPPEGFEQAPPTPPGESTGKNTGEQTSVYGLPNTDINQHVNVMEYIGGMEDLFTRLVYAHGLPVKTHFIRRAELLFRKPFFPGDPFGPRGRLWVKGRRTLMVGSIHGLDAEGNFSERPHVAARYEGELPAE